MSNLLGIDRLRILFLKPKHIGDGLMLTPTLASVRKSYPDAEIWVAVRKGCEGILKGCSAIDHLVTINAAPFGEKRSKLNWWMDLKLIFKLRKQRFDYLFELGDGHRARLIATLCGAKRTYSVKTGTPLSEFWTNRFDAVADFHWKPRHRVEKDFFSVKQFLPLKDEQPDGIVFERDKTAEWAPGANLKDFVVLHPGTREACKRWSREKWLTVGRYLLTRFENIVISVGPAPNEVAEGEWLQRELGARVLNTAGKASWNQVAGLLCRAKLFVGLDTAAMHLAAACHTPVVALFGPSFEFNWHPWQTNYRIVHDPGYTPQMDDPDLIIHMEARSMANITAEKVVSACEEILTPQTELVAEGARTPADSVRN